MNKICINPKNYKLTQGKPYLIVEEEEDYILIINDNNKTQRYAKDLFEDEVENVPVSPPPPPRRTEQDCINSITVRTNPLSSNVELRYNDIENNENTISYLGRIIFADNSCGIRQYDGLNSIMNLISENVNTEEEDMINLQKALFSTFIRHLLSYNIGNSRWMTFSTNQIAVNEDFYTVLDELAQVSTPWEENPNSRSMIKLWVLNRDLV